MENNERVRNDELCGNSREVDEVGSQQQTEDKLINASEDHQLFLVTSKYQSQVSEVKNQDQKAMEANQEVFHIKKQICQECAELEKFFQEARELKQTALQSTSENIENIQTKLNKNNEKIQQFLQKSTENMTNFQQKKRKFEEELISLESKEKDLESSRNKLQKIHEKLDIVSQFKNEPNSLSLQYYNKIDENQLSQLFLNKNIQNVIVQFTKNEPIKQININIEGEIYIYGFRVSTEIFGIQYLKINLNSKNSKIHFINCKFDGVGLYVTSQNENNDNSILIKNSTISNVLQHGLLIEKFKEFKSENVHVDNVPYACGFRVRDVTRCSIIGCIVNMCGCFGLAFQNCNASLFECSVSNCQKYGILVKQNSQVIGQKIAFSDNKNGSALGNFCGVNSEGEII